MTINYNAHHAAPGAYGTFTLGHFHTRGGFGVNDGRAPGNQHVYAGYTRDGATLQCLPFFEPEHASATAAFLGEHGTAEVPRKLQAFAEADIQRKLGWAADEWTVPGFRLRIDSPFGPIPEPAPATVEALRRSLLPAVTAEIEWDNSDGTTEMTGFFAIHFAKAGVNLLSDDSLTGLEFTGSLGVATPASAGVRVIVGPDLHEALAARVPHVLFSTAGIAVLVPAGEKRTLPLVLSWFVPGIVTGRLEGSYYYTRCFASLLDVTHYALTHHAERARWARELDNALEAAPLNPSQRFLIAHSTRSYYGSSQLLEVAGEPFWIVNEGEYCMMNTFDLSVDQLFFEMRTNPWVVRNILDSFVRHYSYVDELREPAGENLFPGGISFTHDMGVLNRFSPHGHSSYEMPDKPGCFSYMTQEQLCNWILCATTYVEGEDDDAWLRQNEYVVRACLESMRRRDHPDPAQRNGIMGLDSSRCVSGQEITTYDSLDASLGQARNNLYVAVKCWASYLGLARMLHRLGDHATGDQAEAGAGLAAQSITAKFDPALGFIPAVFEGANQSAIIPAIECLVFPLEWGDADAVSSSGRFGSLIQALERHLGTVLRPGLCLCDDGGWKLSSTSRNTWMSKIALCQHVARIVFHVDQPEADAAHEKWQKEGCGYWAFCDQIIDGKPVGSKYYPRGVTSILWMENFSCKVLGLITLQVRRLRVLETT
ncbi:MAG: glycoside hydrolase family 52 protein [Chthoniobacterales bacterium]